MGQLLLPVWKEIESYIKQGISIFPCFDSGEMAKRPCGPWKSYQSEIVDADTLFNLMDVKYDTTAIAIVTGKVSGNLEVIDIDIKNWPGIDTQLFQAINLIHPDLWEKLRIHKSPSGGSHIVYRIFDHEPEGNKKLAWKDGIKEAAIETRGEGGYVLAPPSLGYSVSKEANIPELTWAERCSLFAICEGFNQKITPAKKQAVSKGGEDGIYTENPFSHFNSSAAAETVLQDNGWTFLSENSLFAYYSRPDQTAGKRVGASFNKEKRVYYVFTSSTQFEPSRGYLPATALSLVLFGGDHRKTYAHLVAQGYGKLRADYEKKAIRRALAKGANLPANISDEGAQLANEIKEAAEAITPYGIFWIEHPREGVIIDREKLYTACGGLGFMLHRERLVRAQIGRLDYVTDRDFFDAVKAYIHEQDATLLDDIRNAYEVFIERHGKFTISRLPILQDAEILEDTRDTCFKFFSNGILAISADGIQLTPYETCDRLIWNHKIWDRSYTYSTGGRYREFLALAIGTTHSEHLKRCIGFLAHEFKDETTGYIITLTEQCENPKDGGGSGKNVFSSLLRHITTYMNTPGSQLKFDEKFMQSWNGERVRCLSDVPKNFPFEFLKELSTGDGVLKKLFKDERSVSSSDMPKWLVSTNYSVNITDGGLKRRVMFIEFTDFFTRAGGVDVHFGCHFPNGWTDEDWAGYYSYMAESIQTWLRGNLKIHAPALTEGGWAKQFEQTWGHVTAALVRENIEAWLNTGWVAHDDFQHTLTAFYAENNTPKHFQPSNKNIYGAIESYCQQHKYQFLNNNSRRDEIGNVKKYKWFGRTADVPF